MYNSIITDRETLLWFGKYRGQSIIDVLSDQPSYLIWACANIVDFDLHHTIYEEAELDNLETDWQRLSEFHWRHKTE